MSFFQKDKVNRQGDKVNSELKYEYSYKTVKYHQSVS